MARPWSYVKIIITKKTIFPISIF